MNNGIHAFVIKKTDQRWKEMNLRDNDRIIILSIEDGEDYTSTDEILAAVSLFKDMIIEQ